MLEAFLELEMEEHLGYPKHDPEGRGSGNSRNGATSKTVRGDFGQVELESPRDRNSSFEPKIVQKRQRRFVGFDEKILALYSRGLSTRDIEAHLQEIYGVKVGRDLISRAADAGESGTDVRAGTAIASLIRPSASSSEGPPTRW